ncbi:hypothetical protein, partial [Haloferula sp.]|uniref:hypothetical protein n=1 Tax=Haloferula sp. TaxID=2497595 RepID=UPI003C73301E
MLWTLASWILLSGVAPATITMWTLTGTLDTPENSAVESVFSDRGRNGALVCAAPPSEPDRRISRIRLSSQWFAPLRRLVTSAL